MRALTAIEAVTRQVRSLLRDYVSSTGRWEIEVLKQDIARMFGKREAMAAAAAASAVGGMAD